MSLLSSVRRGGPGWLQGAMTLGGGSAITSLTIGAGWGYEFLWLQPVAMLIGCIMLFALAHQTLSTDVRPFQALRRFVSPALAWAWALAALVASIVWGFSHYPLAAGMLEAAGQVVGVPEFDGAGRELYLFGLAVIVWVGCAWTVWHYHDGRRAVQLFEHGIKLLSGLIFISFAWLVVMASLNGQIDWAAAVAGLLPTSLPSDAAGVTTLMSALGSAVGINMTFVFGYTMLARGWGREDRTLARTDIVLGLVLPYLIVTGLISIAAAGLLYDGGGLAGKLNPAQASAMFVQAGLGEIAGALVFPLGVVGMVVGSLVMHMLTCGAAAGEMFDLPEGSRGYRLACLLPTPAVLGVFLWSSMGPWIVLPVSAITGVLLPIAYVGWLLLNNSAEFLGPDRPAGGRRVLFNTGMMLCIVTVLASVVYSTGVRLGWW